MSDLDINQVAGGSLPNCDIFMLKLTIFEKDIKSSMTLKVLEIIRFIQH